MNWNLSPTDTVALVSALLPLALAVAGFLYQVLLHHLPANQQAMLSSLANSVVSAVEKQHAGENSATKKAAAVDAINALAKAFHLSVNSTLVNMLVEAAVYEMDQFSGLAPSAPATPSDPGVGGAPIPSANGAL